jgi:coenzyme PQQ precursor peptide PqqA
MLQQEHFAITRHLRFGGAQERGCLPAANDRTLSFLEKTMWTKPEFTEMRFGFEVTMYIANR